MFPERPGAAGRALALRVEPHASRPAWRPANDPCRLQGPALRARPAAQAWRPQEQRPALLGADRTGFARVSAPTARDALTARRFLGTVLAGLFSVVTEFVACPGRYATSHAAKGSGQAPSCSSVPARLRLRGLRLPRDPLRCVRGRAPDVPATNSVTTAAQRWAGAVSRKQENEGSESSEPVSVKSKATRPRSGHNIRK